MNKLETIESLVQKIPCPVCLNSRFEINLSCDGFIGKDILWSLNGLEYESIVTPPLSDRDSGLSRPTVTVTVWAGKDSKMAGKVIVGKKVENEAQYFARVEGDPNLYRIKARLFESLPKDVQKFKKPVNLRVFLKK